MNKIIFFFLFLFCSGSVGAITPKDFKQFLKNLDVVSVDIDQTRYVRALDKSFKSKSIAEFNKKEGTVKWNDDGNNSFISSKTTYKTNNGDEKHLADLPYFSDIKEIIDEVLDGNIDALEDVFDVTYSTKLILVPTISEISDIILKICIDLDEKQLNSVEIYYKNGDKVVLNFRRKEISGKEKVISNSQHQKKNDEDIAEKR